MGPRRLRVPDVETPWSIVTPIFRRGAGLAATALLAATVSACANVPTAAVGECLNSSELGDGEVSSLPTFPCENSHDLEVYEVANLPDGEFPGDDAVQDAAEDLCIAAFEPYVGSQYAESELFINFITPTQATWESSDDREVICLLVSEESTDSLKGTAK